MICRRAIPVAMIAALVSAPVFAQRWAPRTRIGVWIDASHAPPAGEILVARAMAAWSGIAEGRLTLERVADRATAGIRVRFVPGDRTFGETEPRVDVAGTIVSAEIALADDPGGDLLTQRITVYLTALHEIGHALGLPHSDRFESIMYRFRRADDGERFFTRYRLSLRSPADIGSSTASGLSDEDVRALRALYDR